MSISHIGRSRTKEEGKGTAAPPFFHNPGCLSCFPSLVLACLATEPVGFQADTSEECMHAAWLVGEHCKKILPLCRYSLLYGLFLSFPQYSQWKEVMWCYCCSKEFLNPNTIKILGDVNILFISGYLVSRSMGGLVDVNNTLCGKPTWSILSFGFVRIFSSKLNGLAIIFVPAQFYWCIIGEAFSRANEWCLQNLYHHMNKTKGWLYNCFILG
jgi:hypothetical protein